MVGDGLGDSVGSGPSGLEIETAGDAVDVEHLASKIHPRTHTTLEGGGMDARQRHTAAGDKLVAERCPSRGGDAVTHQGVGKAVDVLFPDVHPSEGGPIAQTFFHHIVP